MQRVGSAAQARPSPRTGCLHTGWMSSTCHCTATSTWCLKQRRRDAAVKKNRGVGQCRSGRSGRGSGAGRPPRREDGSLKQSRSRKVIYTLQPAFSRRSALIRTSSGTNINLRKDHLDFSFTQTFHPMTRRFELKDFRNTFITP